MSVFPDRPAPNRFDFFLQRAASLGEEKNKIPLNVVREAITGSSSAASLVAWQLMTNVRAGAMMMQAIGDDFACGRVAPDITAAQLISSGTLAKWVLRAGRSFSSGWPFLPETIDVRLSPLMFALALTRYGQSKLCIAPGAPALTALAMQFVSAMFVQLRKLCTNRFRPSRRDVKVRRILLCADDKPCAEGQRAFEEVADGSWAFHLNVAPGKDEWPLLFPVLQEPLAPAQWK
jgi:hypothetical protein